MKKHSQTNTRLVALLIALFLGTGTVCADNNNNYDFTTVCSTGQTLYCKIIDETNHYVELSAPWGYFSSGNYWFVWYGYTKPRGIITLPSSISYNGITYTVTSIGEYAFDNCDGLTGSLTIPNSVTSIGNYAFSGCGFTGTLTIPSSVTTIEQAAFRNCSGFAQVNYNAADCGFSGWWSYPPFENCGGSLVIGNNVQRIPYAMFKNAGFTGPLTIPNSVTEIHYGAFYQCTGFTGSLTIPSSVTEIGGYAFYQCTSFTGSLTIPNSVTEIGEDAFYGCTGFAQVNYNAIDCGNVDSTPFEGCYGTLTIGNNVERIPANMFQAAAFYGTLTIPSSVTSIGASAFKGCSGFTQVNYNATNCGNADVLEPPFENCGGVLIIGNEVQKIPDDMFQNAGFIGTLTIPNSVTSIGARAFGGCTGFNGSLTIPSSVRTIKDLAFKNCSGFTQVNFLARNCYLANPLGKPFEGCGGTLVIIGVEMIDEGMFREAGFSGALTIPNSVKKIGNRAFYYCSGFTGVLTIGTSVTEIGEGAFKGCSGFEQVNYNATNCNHLISGAENPFEDCADLLTIGNNVKKIPGYLFRNASFTGSLTIPNSVNVIASYAFAGCSGFTSMTVLRDAPPSLGDNVFDGVPKTIPLCVPCASVSAYQSAAGWSEFTNITCMSEVNVAAVPTAGGTVTGGGSFMGGSTCTVTATPNTGYQFMNWSQDGEVVSCNTSYSFTVNDDTDLEAVFMPTSGITMGTVIGSGESVSYELPCYSDSYYTLSQQIYTADELGGSKTITSISFFNAGAEVTRNLDIYLKHTNKSSFSSNTGYHQSTEWIAMTSSDKVYGGEVTMRKGAWTTIVLDTPFSYSGSYNLALTVDDNTGDWSDGSMGCRSYATDSYQSLYYDGYSDLSPASPSSYPGMLLTQKNQIILNRSVYAITVASANSTAGTVSGGGQYGKGDLCRLKATANPGFVFLDWTNASGAVVSTDVEYSFIVNGSMTLTANFVADGDLCSIIFDLHDSYGDGWNGNYLTVDLGSGQIQRLAVTSGSHANFTLPAVNGSHIDLGWELGSYAYECSFTVSYDNGDVICMGSSVSEDFGFAFDMDCEGHTSAMLYIGDYGETTNWFLPSYTYYNYSLSEQIYTADEIGGAGTLKGIAFYNEGDRIARTFDIYLKTTDKIEFTYLSDWIDISEEDKVFSDEVTMFSDAWVPITFNTPFEYDGSSNLVLVVNDKTGTWTEEQLVQCRVYAAQGYQTLSANDDSYDCSPMNPPGYGGMLRNVKNQLLLDMELATVTQTIPLAAGANWFSPFVETTLVDLQTALTDALGTTGVQISISSQTAYSELKRGNWVGSLTVLDVSRMYIISVSSDCEIALEGLPVNPADHAVTISNGANWIAYPLSAPMGIADVFDGFAVNGDGVSSQTQYSKYTRGNWVGGVNQLEPGKGYIYKSTASGDKEFVFPTGD